MKFLAQAEQAFLEIARIHNHLRRIVTEYFIGGTIRNNRQNLAAALAEFAGGICFTMWTIHSSLTQRHKGSKKKNLLFVSWCLCVKPRKMYRSRRFFWR